MVTHASEDDKREAQKIVEQTQKVSSLIVNLRRLSSAERIDAKALGPVNLRVLFADIEKTRKETLHGKELVMTVHYPKETEVSVRGGSVTEDMISEFIDNAVTHAGKKRIEVEITVSRPKGELGDDYWSIEILDNGPGIPDQVKQALDVTSADPKKRFRRGIASSLSVMPLVAEQLGGRIRIEDRVPGDHTQGTRVTLVLPEAT